MIIKITEDELRQLKKDGEIKLKVIKDGMSFNLAYDTYCRHNDAKYPEIHDLRKEAHWFEVVHTVDTSMCIGDKILVSRGYITNATQGWTYDPLGELSVCGPSFGGRDWVIWPENRGGFFNVHVKKL